MFLQAFNLCWIEHTVSCKYDPNYRKQWENGDILARMVRKKHSQVEVDLGQSLVQPPYTGKE